MSDLGGLFQGIGQMVSSAINSGVNYKMQKETNETNYKIAQESNEANRQLQELAYQQNIEQWNRENEYNSPTAQMQRYKDAGLNANLIYGQQNTSASSPKLSYLPQNVAHMEAPKINVALDGLFQLLNLKNTIKENDLDLKQKAENLELTRYSNLMAAEKLKQAMNDTLYHDRLNLGRVTSIENQNSLFPFRKDELQNKLKLMEQDLQLKGSLNQQQEYKLKILKHQADFWDKYGMDPSQAPFFFKVFDSLYSKIFGGSAENIIKSLGERIENTPYPSTHQ